MYVRDDRVKLMECRISASEILTERHLHAVMAECMAEELVSKLFEHGKIKLENGHYSYRLQVIVPD